jgi:hypothetical protein
MTSSPESDMDATEKKCLEDIDKYGCHVIHVLAEGNLPPFTYSVGIERSMGHPEAIVIGLRQEVAHFIINEYCSRIRAGSSFKVGERVQGFLESYDCEMRGVSPSFYKEYVGWNLWLYRGSAFRLLQIVYPTTSGLWPWDDQTSEGFKAWQPLLDS